MKRYSLSYTEKQMRDTRLRVESLGKDFTEFIGLLQ
jgi:hypothetical protein